VCHWISKALVERFQTIDHHNHHPHHQVAAALQILRRTKLNQRLVHHHLVLDLRLDRLRVHALLLQGRDELVGALHAVLLRQRRQGLVGLLLGRLDAAAVRLLHQQLGVDQVVHDLLLQALLVDLLAGCLGLHRHLLVLRGVGVDELVLGDLRAVDLRDDVGDLVEVRLRAGVLLVLAGFGLGARVGARGLLAGRGILAALVVGAARRQGEQERGKCRAEGSREL
jgi:hypothetical protein